MGLDFGKKEPAAVQPAVQNEIEAVEVYDIVEDRKQMNNELVGSDEVDALVSTIEVNNLETIVSFGAEAADEISKASDIVLNSMSMSQIDESSEMLNALSKIMSKFDIDEIREDKGLFNKLFGNLRKQLEKILQKYHTMGDELEMKHIAKERNLLISGGSDYHGANKPDIELGTGRGHLFVPEEILTKIKEYKNNI